MISEKVGFDVIAIFSGVEHPKIFPLPPASGRGRERNISKNSLLFPLSAVPVSTDNLLNQVLWPYPLLAG